MLNNNKKMGFCTISFGKKTKKRPKFRSCWCSFHADKTASAVCCAPCGVPSWAAHTTGLGSRGWSALDSHVHLSEELQT